MMIGFSFIDISSVERIEVIKEEIREDEKIRLERLGFEGYSDMSRGKWKEEVEDLKEYYNLVKEMRFKIMGYGRKQ